MDRDKDRQGEGRTVKEVKGDRETRDKERLNKGLADSLCQIDRQTDRQTDRQIDRQIDRKIDRL